MEVITHTYTCEKLGDRLSVKVFVALLTDKEDVLCRKDNQLIQELSNKNLNSSIGLYFYRFKDLTKVKAFSKIGEVSRKDGIGTRLQRGWLGTEKYGDTYLTKNIFKDVCLISEKNPMYFVFYEQVPEYCLPKIDEIHAYKKHLEHFGRGTTNAERINKNDSLGAKLVWRESAFNEVLNLRFPDRSNYGI